MKKTPWLCGLLAACALLLTSCAPPLLNLKDFPIQDTPVRVGKARPISVTYAGSIERDLDSVVTEAELIADVSVVSWLSEDLVEDKRRYQTYFNVKVNAVCKGKAPKNIVLAQIGNSEMTEINYPLFTIGNRMLLFLRKAVDTGYKNAYVSVNSQFSVMDLQTVDGVTYAMDRFSFLTKNIMPERKFSDGQPVSSIGSTAFNQLKAHPDDPLWKDDDIYDRWSMHRNILFYDEIVQAILRQVEREKWRNDPLREGNSEIKSK